MQQITIEKVKAVNIPALDKALRDALGEAVFGLQYSEETVTVYLKDEASSSQINQAKSVVQGHDPNVLSPEQQAEVARKSKLEQTRNDFGADDIDLAAYGSQSALIKQLAQKVAWLEQEIAELRGGVQG